MVKFYYDKNNLKIFLYLKNEIFNVPFNLIIENNKFNKKKYIQNFLQKK